LKVLAIFHRNRQHSNRMALLGRKPRLDSNPNKAERSMATLSAWDPSAPIAAYSHRTGNLGWRIWGGRATGIPRQAPTDDAWGWRVFQNCNAELRQEEPSPGECLQSPGLASGGPGLLRTHLSQQFAPRQGKYREFRTLIQASHARSLVFGTSLRFANCPGRSVPCPCGWFACS
jgi:hypothetical protein